jgi:GT2 family glycosyltransferase/tetratricopeptide (TPR) repeat protein
MSWRWNIKPNDSSPTEGSAATPTTPLETLLAQADTLRDARRWPEAATAYQAVLNRAPQRAAIWVQLGHALKESANLAAAEGAYRQSLALAPDIADTHLQLGHVLKLQGHRPAAVTAYAAALKADRSCTPAITELLALGEAWEADQNSDLGLPLLANLLHTTTQLRATLARLEAQLPAAVSLAAVPPALFHTRYTLPPAPPAKPINWDVVILDGGEPLETIALLRSLGDPQPSAITVIGTDPATRATLDRYGFTAANVTSSGPLPPSDWHLIARSGSRLTRNARSWLDWAANETQAQGFYTDESDPAPVLKTAHDPEPDAPLFRHSVLAVRGTAHLPPDWLNAPDPLQALADHLTLAHLPRILAELTTAEPAAPRRTVTQPTPPPDSRIGVIIPTRNGGAVLREAIDALRATAVEPARLDIVIIDNGSDDPGTLAHLTDLQALGAIRVIKDPAAFNWSRLNNAGAAAIPSDLLLFMNDDVTLQGHGWDIILRQQLARPEIGAVGARLDYPDGGIQHAGIVFGPGGRTEHEGVAALNVSPDIAARWTTRRQVAAVTGAFLACRRTDFTAVKGFDTPYFPIWFNDIDFCLKLRRTGLTILYEPAIKATHHESRTLSTTPLRLDIWADSLKTMQQRWGDALTLDPGFNPQFARTGRPFELMMEPSFDAVRAHFIRSARPDPWRPD